MKVIFLDVDGVLNIMSNSYYSCSFLNNGNDPIELHLMKRLEFILERVPDANIVISSAWGYKQLIIKLKMHRFKYIERIIDETPRGHTLRGDQIKEWLDNNQVSNYVVIEDEISDVCGDKCSTIPINHVVEVDMNEGLSHKNTIDAIMKLNDIKEIEDKTYELTIDLYDYYFNKGYTPQVALPRINDNIDYEKMLSKWSKFTLDNKNLYMLLSK